jgi:hypothetical protein
VNTAPDTSHRLLELARAVLAKSRNNEITWSETATQAYFVPLGDYFLQVESVDRDGRHPFEVHLEDADFNVMTRLKTSDTPFGPDEGTDWTSVIADLYEEARRKGSSVERALDELLELVKEPPASSPS